MFLWKYLEKLEGHFDGVEGNRVRGWVTSIPDPAKRLSVEIFVEGVSCLSGFATSQRSGERFVFSVLVNNYGDGGTAAAHALQDGVGIALCDR